LGKRGKRNEEQEAKYAVVVFHAEHRFYGSEIF
jgi:hypothetical protein